MESTSIFIPDEIIYESLKEWRFSLVGRLDLVHLKFSLAESVLRKQWKRKGSIQLIPIGKGFFIIKLDNEDDMKLIYEGHWEVENQILSLRYWEKDFRPEFQKNSCAYVWVTFPGLSIDYWKESILMAIGKSFGRPIRIDETTMKKQAGFYASILVEIDLAKTIPNKVWVESKYGKFEQELCFVKLPKYCNHCKVVGHYVAECRIKRKEHNLMNDNPLKQQKWKYVPKRVNQENSVKFDICLPDNSNAESSANQESCRIPEKIIQTPKKDNGFVGVLNSPLEFPLLSVVVADEEGTIQALKNSVAVEVGEEVNIQALTNINSEVGNLEVWKEVEPKVRVSSGFIKQLRLPGMSSMIIHNSCGNIKVNIWVFLNNSLATPTIISNTKQAITIQVGEVLVTEIHAACVTIDRRILWEELLLINYMKMPWLIIGDFNVVLTCEEKRREKSPKNIYEGV
ncbi:uncharacterized protein LOC113273316 [Papaver somniferum]|uniref:uncharacterized protein LOC113273316 n=1 Tax=Papaver somniferum TaxID=3469 RepID=UPI000E704D86|nr:uncharacterized protein LOC113273316 [Papaver somniferum]